jgi:hypothetical protein
MEKNKHSREASRPHTTPLLDGRRSARGARRTRRSGAGGRPSQPRTVPVLQSRLLRLASVRWGQGNGEGGRNGCWARLRALSVRHECVGPTCQRCSPEREGAAMEGTLKLGGTLKWC